MRGLVNRNAGEGRRRPRVRAGSILMALMMLTSGCASSSRLPWKRIKQASDNLPRPSNSYGVGDRTTGRLPWPGINPGSRGLPEASNDYGVGRRAGPAFPWSLGKPKGLESYKPISPFGL